MKASDSDAIYEYYMDNDYAPQELGGSVVMWVKIKKESQNGNE